MSLSSKRGPVKIEAVCAVVGSDEAEVKRVALQRASEMAPAEAGDMGCEQGCEQRGAATCVRTRGMRTRAIDARTSKGMRAHEQRDEGAGMRAHEQRVAGA